MLSAQEAKLARPPRTRAAAPARHRPRGRLGTIRGPRRSAAAIGRLACVMAISIACLGPSPAIAQQSPARTHVIVTREAAPLRAKDFERAYAVATLPKGTPLRVVGDGNEDQRWFRVHYPKKVGVLVEAADASPTSDDSAVVLSAPSRLKALHEAQGLHGSWATALPKPLPEGTRLTLRRTIRSPDGRVQGYVVDAPRSARAHIHRRHVRWAAPDESTRLESDQRSDQTGSSDAQPDAASSTLATPEPAEAESDDSLIDPMIEPDEAGGQPTGTDESQEADARNDEPVVIDQSAESGSTPRSGRTGDREVGDRLILSIEELNEKYAQLKDQPLVDAEWRPLLAEHQRALDALSDDPFSERLRRQIRARIELINARIKLQDRILEPLREAAERSQPIERIDPKEVRSRVDRIKSAVGYAFIGRLTPSSLYDGVRLPRLYRLRAVDGSRRTLGYLEPSDRLDLRARLGQTVGVVGSVDESTDLPVRLIDAVQVDPIRPDESSE